MSGCAQPCQRIPDCHEPSVTGRDLGFIHRKYFEPATWEPLFRTEMGRGQYSKFVASMIERIHLKESSYDEIRSFVHLIATEHNWDFMKLAMPHLPELKEQCLRDTENFDIALLFLLKPKMRRRSINVIRNATSAPKTYQNGLSKTEEQCLRRNLFGPMPEAVDSPGMARLFKSTLELGYPQPALDESMRRARERGTDIERCCLGLPMKLRMPHACTRPETFSSSSSHYHEPGTAEVWNPDSDSELLEFSSSSTIVVDEPIELLTELAVDGLDPPVPIIPDKTMASHEELPTLNRMEDIEAFVSMRAASPDRPRVPCDESPRTKYGSTEREAFKSSYNDPPSNFLDYFHLLERAPHPQIPASITEWLEWPEWPNSPSTLCLSPIAEPFWNGTNAVAMPGVADDCSRD